MKLKCLLKHQWETFQHSIRTDDRSRSGSEYVIVIAYKICKKCAKSKLIHILE